MKIYFFFLLLLLTSCIKEVDLNLDNLPERVVVNGAICPDSSFKVRVSFSSGMKEQKKLIENATISVFEDGEFIYYLPHAGDGWYRVWASPIEGKHYRIEVAVPGFEMVYAETDIPVFPPIIDAWFEKAGEIDMPHSPAFTNFYASTTIVFQDDPNQDNFYVPSGGFGSDYTKETDESILTESDLDFDPLYYYFSDALFQGQVKSLTMKGGGTIFQFGETSYFQDDYKRDFAIVSKEFFWGIKTWTLHKYNQSSDSYVNDPLTLLFLGEPIEMYTNVVGGLGVFAGYNSKQIPVAPHE